MAKFCTECGCQNVDEVTFCGGCGLKQDDVIVQTITQKLRGKVLRDTSNGNGLISADGKQYEFSLEKNWKSDIAPKIGVIVEFYMGNSGEIQSVSAVNESQLAKEQADIAMRAAKEKGRALFKEASARVGTSVLIAWACIAISWFFLNILSISVTSVSNVGITFWNLLGIINNSTNMAYLGSGATGDKGIYALLAIVALVGPALSQFWKHPLAYLGNCMPFALMLLASVMIYMSLHDAASQAQQTASAFGGLMGGNVASSMITEMMSAIMKAIHIGAGAPIAVIASAYLAFVGAKQYLVAKAQA